jgi:XTP/dITP diphosphohydrolase
MKNRKGSPLLIATNNKGKIRELQDLLKDVEIELTTPAQIHLELDVVENGRTYAENASKKAVAFARASGRISLADDSGLEVDALDGAPGVYSARYAGVSGHGADAANNAKLLAALAGVPPERRTGRFRASLALADVTGPLGADTITADGVCEGILLDAPRGSGGFGYDPLFLFPELGQTFAELGVGTKGDLSHRARAMRAIKPRLLAYLQQIGDGE